MLTGAAAIVRQLLDVVVVVGLVLINKLVQILLMHRVP